MKHNFLIMTVGIFFILLTACSPAPLVTPDAPATKAAEAAETAVFATQEAALFPLSAPGPYHVGMRTYRLNDPGRDNRRVSISIWYPTAQSPDASFSAYTQNAEPDLSAAPYPLILSSTKMANTLAPYLVSRGFTWASVNLIDTYMEMQEQMYEQPLDILFALQVAASNPEGLEGVIDAEHAGAIGYSFDGYNALALSGARVDPDFYLSLCASPDAQKSSELSSFSCKPASNWDRFTAKVGEAITTSQDGMWQPMTDERILAVMPMACEGWWLFGEKGLAAVNRPVLMLVASGDELYPENVQIYEHLGTTDKTLLSFNGLSHMMIFDPHQIARMAHFAAAFFGVYLQGREDLALYFSQEGIEQYDDITWGLQGP